MSVLRAVIDAPTSARDALGRAAAFAESLRPALAGQGHDPTLSATLYAAELTGAAAVLGAYQHAPHALSAGHDLEVLRRTTGGASVWGGTGVLYVALALRDASALIACPPGKILNRYVRGLLNGLRALGLPAHYFGRDFVSLDAEPVAYVAWEEHPFGSVRLEAFIGHARTFALPQELSAYPTPEEPRFRGRALTTLIERSSRPLDPRATLEAIGHGHVRAFGAQLEGSFDSSVLTDEQLARATILAASTDQGEELPGLHWSAPHEEVIGFVGAGVALDASGRIRAVRLRGDFFMSSSVASELEERLVGSAPTADAFAQALDDVLAARVGLIEGVRSLRSLQAALLDATERARQSDA